MASLPTATRAGWLSLAMMLTACSSQLESAPKGCGDSACFRREGARLWAENPTAVIDQVLALSDASERAAVVEAVVEAIPSSSPKLCPLLNPGITRQRCDVIAAEPLLWKLDPAHPADAAQELGEAALVLAPGPTLRVKPFPSTAVPACGTAVPRSSCASWRAREAAMTGDLPGAAGICAAIPALRWRQICLFQAATSGCRAGQTDVCPQAAELCLGAGLYRTSCLSEIAKRLASTAPSAESSAADDWSKLDGLVRELRARLSAADPILADRAVGRTWAEAMLLSYGLVRDVSGAPLDHLPVDALPHVRAAVAWRLAARSSDDDLATRVETVDRLLARRETRTMAEALLPGRLRIAGMWAQDLPGEDEIPWVAYLQDARRPWSPDPTTDAKICVLEAAARMSPVQDDLLVEGLGDEHEIVRWTAARLLAATKPGHIALAHARDDQSALVRQRASLPQSPSSG